MPWMHLPLLLFLALVSASPSDSHAEIVVGLKLQRLDALEKAFWEISNPHSSQYLSFMNITTLSEMIGPTPATVDRARTWLLAHGADPQSLRYSALGDRITARVPNLLGATVDQITNVAHGDGDFDFVLYRSGNSKVPSSQSRPKQPFSSSSSLSSQRYSIKAQKAAYGIPNDLQASDPRTLQMVWGPGTFGYSKSQLSAFKDEQCPLLNMDKVLFDTENHGESGGDNYGEGNLDVSMIASFGLNITTLVSNTNTSMSTEEGNGFGEAMLDFLTSLANRETLPQVLSLSLGSLSAYSCDLLCEEAEKKGHAKSDCNAFLQEQRQVCMFLTQKQVGRISTALQVLGVRGVSVFGSSGDGGSHFSFDRFEGGSALADDLNEISCSFQMPVFPTGSPYITSVGGTLWKGTLFPDPSHPVAWPRSGGGFAWQFPRPAHQDNMIKDYLQSTAGLPPPSSYNSSARGYPDVSAISEDGTSQSSPTVAGIFSLLMDMRLQAGLKPLGFLGPRLYMVAEKFPGEAFQDVTEGSSAYHCDNGFPSAKGWDPVTGLGRPVWQGLMKHFASDDDTLLS